ncbi:RBBP6 ligase, partial [Burhinus bistriatus]|nr:RBBP6 ligase [Burhinus bistriatus]
KKGNIKNPANASQEVDMHREDSPQMEPPVKKVKRDLPKTDNVKTSSSQKDEKALGTPQKVDPKVTEDHPATRPAKEEKAKNDHPKETKSEKASNKEDKSKKPAEKSKPSDAKPGKRKVNEKVDKDHEATSIKVSKAETAESKTSPKGKTEPDGEKGERTPAKDKSAFLDNPAKKTELNQETGKKFVSGEKVPPAKEPVEKPEPSSSKVKQEKAKGNVRRKVTAPDGSSSALVDYSSTSSPGGSAVRKAEEEPDTRQTVMKTMEEDSNDIPAPAEDVIIMMQIPQSKWDKDDFESEEEDIKSTQVPASVGEPANAIKNVSAKPPNPVKHNEKETEPLEETQKTTKEASYKGCQHDAKSSRSLMSNEKGKTKDKDPSEQRKRSVQRGKDHSECATKQGNGKNISQSSKDHRSSEKHDPGRGSTAKDFPPNQDKKSDCDGNRDCPSSKCRDEKSELARGKDSPSQCRESISVQKSKRRDKRAEPSKKGTGDAKRSSYSPPCEQKQADDKAAHDSKRTLEEHKPLDKNSEDEKHVPPEVKSNEEKEPGGNKPPLRQESPDVKNEKENVTGQNDGNVVKPNPPVSSSSWLSSALTRETDEAAFVPDCSESDSESNGGGFGSKSQASKQDSNVSAKDEEAAGKNPKEPKEKAVDKVKEDTAAPAAADQPEASRSQRQSSASVSHKACLSQSLSESQTRSHSGSAGSGESQGSKKK